MWRRRWCTCAAAGSDGPSPAGGRSPSRASGGVSSGGGGNDQSLDRLLSGVQATSHTAGAPGHKPERAPRPARRRPPQEQEQEQQQQQGPGQQQQQQQAQRNGASNAPVPAGAILAPSRRRVAAAAASRPAAGDPAAAASVPAAGGGLPPVLKGDLALPGGPQWSALRRHVHAAGSNPDLPTMKAVVIVEGDEDQRAVSKAVNAPVYVCDGTRVLRPHVAKELEALASLGRPLVILTDPDERGRQLRGHLDAALAPPLAARSPPPALLHAFVPEASAVALEDGKVHAAGNRGIEHAVPRVLVRALRAAAPGHPPGRAAWDLERLHRLRLARPFDGGGGGDQGAQAEAADEPRERRRRLCALLGLGKCSAAQLVVALNKYFDEARVEAALAALDGGQPAGGGGGDERSGAV
ncbi:hypothetical protein Rsub_10824 [Raphidocelis subcapitata]|uniref:Uncharacterized protein n=1 Tax=Raphidocelis subcapitata TaxID=307507 RepID=A0A2V0PNE1_9CHLO|nr:hypothetical protein Rsub_10824 [Raphidocelis subcapitata]|eukprot:GBF98635.1 hypothetical protein Rsub_10824 [Raphidocelis subcapitata]